MCSLVFQGRRRTQGRLGELAVRFRTARFQTDKNLNQSEGARTAYFIPERVGEGEAAATESTLFVRRVGRRRAGRDPPTKETLRFCLLGWVAAGPRNDPPL